METSEETERVAIWSATTIDQLLLKVKHLTPDTYYYKRKKNE